MVESVRSVKPNPQAVLVSGDLADHATDSEYARVRELLAGLEMATCVLPGNHDDRRALRRHFGLPGVDGEPIQYTVDLGPLRLIVLDSARPGEDGGALDDGRLDWLAAELDGAPELPTVIAMHHPPLVTGVPAWDAICLSAADRCKLGDVIAAHRQVRRIVAGHVHRTIVGELAGHPVLTVPSTYVQGRPRFGAQELEFVAEPLGFAVHALLDDELISHVQPVAQDDGVSRAARPSSSIHTIQAWRPRTPPLLTVRSPPPESPGSPALKCGWIMFFRLGRGS